MVKPRSHNEWFRPVNTRAKTETRLTLPLAEYCCYKCNQVSTRAVEQVQNGCTCQQSISIGFCNGILNPIPLCKPYQKEYQGHAGYESSRKSCPTCKAKLELDEFVWSWGEYRNAKWHTVTHFCKSCFQDNVQLPLQAHAIGCGCSINLVSKGCSLPQWLSLESTPCRT